MLQMKFVCLLFTFVHAIYGRDKEQCFNNNDEALITSMKQMLQTLTWKMQVLEKNFKKKPAHEICPVDCPSGWKRYSGHCYYFGSDRRSWTSAKTVCNRKDGYLVKIENSAENRWLQKVMKELGLNNLWIGANDRSKEGRWRWESDQSYLTFSDWNPNQPDDGSGSEDCAHLYKGFSYRWNDDQCWNRAGYICERV